MSPARERGPLAGVRVVDLADARGRFASKILAELGADVIAVEPPGGDLGARRGPYLGGVADPERSLPWLAENTSKRGLALDLGRAADRATLDALLARADVLIDSQAPGTLDAPQAPGTLDARGFGWEALRERHPRLVVCSITPFGRAGPTARLRAHDLVVVAMGGNAWMTGDPDRAPLRCTLPSSTYHACAEAALAVVFALHAREASGRGQLADVSMQECQLGTLLTGPGQAALRGARGGRTGPRLGRTREIWRAADGYVSFGLRAGPARVPNLVATVAWMAEEGLVPDWLRELDWSRYDPNALSAEELARLEDAFAAFFRAHSMRELYEGALARRILLAPCNDAHEVLQHPQLRARGFFERLEYPHLGAALEHPRCFAHASDGGVGLRGRAPRVDEHRGEILAELARSQRAGEVAPDARRPASGAPLFAGLRVLELGSGAAGPVVTRYFAEYGAHVIKLESSRRRDFLRLLAPAGDTPDASPMFLLLNPNKESLSVDLTRDEGVALVRRLVATADVVCENFAPGVLERFGLDYEALRAIKPDLVMVRSALFGQTGPQRQYPGFGGQGSAIAGFNELTGWPDREALGPYATITDSLSPRFAAVAVAAALYAKRRTGRGLYLDVSQIEAGVYSLSEWIVRHSAGAPRLSRMGNRSEHAAPHGVFPCAGDDRWIAIAAWTDAEWRALCEVLEAGALAGDPRFATGEARLAAADALEAAVAERTRSREAFALMQALQDAGVEAGVVQTFEDLLRDPGLAARGHFVRIPHRRLGELAFERSGFRLSDSPGALRTPGPDLGEHTHAVLRELLGLSEGEIRDLESSGVLR
jgi:crotonobetainyl-CoA:carnitine CoA-transferase CaiB-like acyl-CoA transferase